MSTFQEMRRLGKMHPMISVLLLIECAARIASLQSFYGLWRSKWQLRPGTIPPPNRTPPIIRIKPKARWMLKRPLTGKPKKRHQQRSAHSQQSDLLGRTSGRSPGTTKLEVPSGAGPVSCRTATDVAHRARALCRWRGRCRPLDRASIHEQVDPARCKFPFDLEPLTRRRLHELRMAGDRWPSKVF